MEKNNPNIILIQEPPQFITKHVLSPTTMEGDPVHGYPSYHKWITFVRIPDYQDNILHAITYINKRLNKLQPMLRRDIINHKDINLVFLLINNRCSYILNVYSDNSQTATSFLQDHELNIKNILIMTGDFNI